MPYKIETIPGLGRVKLNLELNPKPSLTGGDILAVATFVATKDNTPIEGQTLKFLLGDDWTEYKETNPDGIASFNFANLGFGNYMISVFLEGYTGLTAVARHSFPWIAPPKLAEPKIDVLGQDGNYSVTVSVNYENGRTADKTVIIIKLFFPDRLEQRFEEIKGETNKEGIYTYDLKFSSYECDAIVYVGQYSKEFKNLAGRPKRPKPIITPEPTVRDLEDKGIIRALIDGYKRGHENLKKRSRRHE